MTIKISGESSNNPTAESKKSNVRIISEINTSICLRLLLRLMRHEGWSYEIDVFSPDSICNDPSDPWSANCSIPQMLFENPNKFESIFRNSKIIHYKPTEFLILPLSGGVISKTKTINLPVFILHSIHLIDKILIKIFPYFFSLGMEVVIQKK